LATPVYSRGGSLNMRSTRLSCITAAIIIAVASFVPAASHAAQVTLRAFNASGALIATCGPVGSSSAATSGTVTLPSTCGPFQISPYVSTPQLAGLAQSSGNQVVVRNAVIRNAGTATARLQIDGFHTFILPSGVTVFQNRFYGIGLSATFNRLNGTVLASGDKIVKKGYYAYFIGQTQSREDQIGGTATGGVTLSYTVPSTGSLTTNAVPIPSPSAREPTSPDTRRCINLVSTNNCTSNLERLRTVVDVTIAAGDKVTIPTAITRLQPARKPTSTPYWIRCRPRCYYSRIRLPRRSTRSTTGTSLCTSSAMSTSAASMWIPEHSRSALAKQDPSARA
jgi:hypothetical protein